MCPKCVCLGKALMVNFLSSSEKKRLNIVYSINFQATRTTFLKGIFCRFVIVSCLCPCPSMTVRMNGGRLKFLIVIETSSQFLIEKKITNYPSECYCFSHNYNQFKVLCSHLTSHHAYCILIFSLV